MGTTPLKVFHQLFWNFSAWCFVHGMKMCIWFRYNPLIIFSHFFCFVNLVYFWYEMLSRCIDSGYLVGATPLTVLHWLFWNFTDVFCMEWRYACGFHIFFSHFFWFVNLVSFLHEMLSKCIDSGYLVCATPLTVFTDCFETLQMFSAWNEDMHVVWVQYFEYFFSLFLLCELSLFYMKCYQSV